MYQIVINRAKVMLTKLVVNLQRESTCVIQELPGNLWTWPYQSNYVYENNLVLTLKVEEITCFYEFQNSLTVSIQRTNKVIFSKSLLNGWIMVDDCITIVTIWMWLFHNLLSTRIYWAQHCALFEIQTVSDYVLYHFYLCTKRILNHYV